MKEKMVDAAFGENGVFRVRGLMTMWAMALIGYLVVDGQLGPDEIIPLASMIVSFYFVSRLNGTKPGP